MSAAIEKLLRELWEDIRNGPLRARILYAKGYIDALKDAGLIDVVGNLDRSG